MAEIESQEVVIKQREDIITQQARMTISVDNLAVHIDQAREELEAAVSKLTSTMMGIWQVPIAVAVIGVASWAFFFKYIEEWTWLMLLAIAAFRYLGDSITAVAKLFGIGRHNGKETK